MTDATNGGAGNDAPQMNVLAQYIKDFSFENPQAPQSLTPQNEQPSVNMQVNINARQIGETEFEVELKLEGRCETPNMMLFSFDLAYAGVFRVQNVPQDQMHPVMMIECPRLLFPFAREIVESSVRNSGFPPLMLQPVDFVLLYRQKLMEQQGAGGTTMLS